MRLFERTFQITPETSILDVGGAPAIWQYSAVLPRITMLNLPSAVDRSDLRMQHVAGDGCLLPFRDQSFDIVFSNSVIEHVGSLENQRRFAAEVERVGRSYWIQTPDRHAPFEMHVMLPLIHHLPKPWQRAIIHRFTLWEYLTHPSPEDKRFLYHHVIEELRLLDSSEMRQLFSKATILREGVLGIPKSLVAVRGPFQGT